MFDETATEPEKYIASQLNSIQSGNAIIGIFQTALNAYVTTFGAGADPDAAVRFARAVVRASMNNDPKAFGPDLVGVDEVSEPLLFEKKRRTKKAS